MQLLIVRGDRTSHGGWVVAGSPFSNCDGVPIARVGDMVMCPLPGHGSNPIIEGSAVFSIGGRKVALHGHKSACGCALIASLPVATIG